MRRGLYLILSLTIVAQLQAQQFNFRHFKVENGLSYNSVMDILQDSRGFMWFATKDGLNRYDGYTFKIYRNIEGDTESIGSNSTYKLLEDASGNILVGTYNGLYRLDIQTEKFTLLSSPPNGRVSGIAFNGKGALWYTMDGNIYRYDTASGKSALLKDGAGMGASCMNISSEKQIWIGFSDGQIAKIDDSGKLIRHKVIHDTNNKISRFIECLLPVDSQNILVGTSMRGLLLYNTDTKETKRLLSVSNDGTELYIRDCIAIGNNEYWIGTESGICSWNAETHSIINITKQQGDPYSLSDNAVYALCKDTEGGIWAGTYFGGLNYMPRQFNHFEKFYPGGKYAISGNAVREIVQDKYDRIWVGTEDAGLNMMDPVSGNFKNFAADKKPGSISHYNVHGLAALDNELWVGYFHHGIDVIDINTLKVIRHYSAGARPGMLKNNFIHSILRTRDDKLLFATAEGVHTYDKASDAFTRLTEMPEYLFYTCLLEDNTGRIWAGTFSDGLYYFNPQTGEKGAIKLKRNDTTGLISDRVNLLFESRSGRIWVATENGLLSIDQSGNITALYNTHRGMPSNMVYSMLEDDEGKLWVSTSMGLVYLSPESGVIRTFTSSSGLLTNQFNYNSAHKDKNGIMYFGSVGGLIRFSTKSLVPETSFPPVYLTGIQINNEEIEAKRPYGSALMNNSITSIKKLTLSHLQNNLSLDFAALRFSNPDMVEYAYFLKGLDDKWIYLKKNRKVFYTDLQPGTYEFQVKAANEKGEWNEAVTSLAIEITPPFWKSNTAYVLYFLIILGILYVIFRYNKKYNEQKNKVIFEQLEHEKDKEIYRSKIDFFTNIAHEIRTPLTLIKLPLEKILGIADTHPSIKEKLLAMEKNTDRLIQLTNQLLDFRKTENEHYRLSFVKTNISSMLQDVYERFKPAAVEKGKNMQIHLPRIPLQAYVDPEALTKIISNLADNAVKYADQDIAIKLLPFNSEDEYFTIQVLNDGLITDAALREKIFEPFFRIHSHEKKEGGTGIGLALSRSLTELHKGTLTLNASDDGKNVFTLRLPIHQELEFNLTQEKAEEPAQQSDFFATPEDHSKPNILLVDDNREILSFIAGELTDKYSVYLASNGAEALRMLEDKAIQLVVSDIMMPVMDGYELCQRMKSDIKFSHIPIILLTAKNSIQSKVEGLEVGAEAYIEKPFSQAYLEAQIASMFQNRERMMHFFSNSPLVHMRSMAHSKADETFLEKLQNVILDNIDDADLDTEKLAKNLNMSRSTLFRKIKDLSNLTPNELINIIRLKKAAELLKDKNLRVYEVSYMVGYKHPSNFSRDFSRQFGKSPADFVKNLDIAE
ncbi:MAG: response regulator [Chitinophagaceae bacterium]|nr:response regulator [Chitinophagaceae bacterium]